MFKDKTSVVKGIGFIGSLLTAIALWVSGQQTEAFGVFAASLSSAGLFGPAGN